MVLYGNNLSQVTDIRATDKSHTASGEREGGKRKKEQVSCLPQQS